MEVETRMEIKKLRNKTNEENEYLPVKQRLWIVFRDFKAIWKYKASVFRKAENKHRDYLKKQSVDNSGVINYQDKYFVTRGEKRYKIFKLHFKEPNGMEKETDIFNKKGLTQIQDILTEDYAILFPQESKYNLQDNIDFYENILSRETSPSRRRTIEENLKLMKFYNEVKYVTIVMMIQESDINKFIRTAEQIMNVHECDYDESMHLLEMLNNEII